MDDVRLWAWLGRPSHSLLPQTRLSSFNAGFVIFLLCWEMCVAPVGSVQTGDSQAVHVLRERRTHPQEVTTPSVLETSAPTRGEDGQFPFRAQIKVTAEGRQLILELQKNRQLLSPDYTETYYSRSGSPITSSANLTEHCYYHGAVRGWKGSHVVLSACSGFRGLISLSGNLSYIIEPLAGVQGLHSIYRTSHLKLPEGVCGSRHSEATPEAWTHPLPSAAISEHHRVRRDDLNNRKYVELYLVADHAEFQKHEYDLLKTKQKMLEVANYMDKFYKSLNIRVALVGLEVWTDGNKCNVTENPYSTLWSFLAWRRKLLSSKKHDNAQLITGSSFHGTTIGLAPLLAMCSVYQSGGVNMDHSDNSIGIASTMAHEMGHNFGMSHDSSGCCAASASDGGCIMAAATGHPFPKVFNKCNRKQLERFLQTGGGMCLSNRPDTSTMYGGPRCGNGYLEDGEECDCGEPEECSNPCCNASNCTLKPGAECAHGICCQQCRLRAPGTLCRKEARPCDFPEYCTGESSFCPPDSYQLDGTPCQEDRAYCYSGMCLTHQQQCSQLWGPGARLAPEVCFQKVNAAGDTYGNCGKDTNGRYRTCAASDARCGKIQCQSSALKPLDANAVAIDTTVSLDGKRIRCRGTHVYRTAEEDSDILDPGLVITGTKCGENQICFEGQCRSVAFFQTEECATKCYGRGICNNNRNCHCSPGWDPPFCNRTGSGGSVDSGPPPADGSRALVFGALTLSLLLMLLPGAAFCLYTYKRRDNPKPSSASSAPQQEVEQPREGSNRDKSSGSGHSNPAYKLKPPPEESKESDCPGDPSAPAPYYRLATRNVRQPPESSGCQTLTHGDLPRRDTARPACQGTGASKKTDTARHQCQESGASKQTDTASLQCQEIVDSKQTDTVLRPAYHGTGTSKQADTAMRPTYHGTGTSKQADTAIRPACQGTGASKEAGTAMRPACHGTGALKHTDTAIRPACRGTEASKQADTLMRPACQGTRASKQTDIVSLLCQESVVSKQTDATSLQCQDIRASKQADTERLQCQESGASKHAETARHSPSRKPIPPARPAPKKFHRADPPRKPLPADPVHRASMVRPETQYTPLITGRKESRARP